MAKPLKSQPCQLALFGQPVIHSQSPKIHQGFAKQFDLVVDYQLIESSAEDLHRKVEQFFAEGGHGANITVPHKQNIMPMLDGLTDRAQQAGAVNTLFKRGHQLWGDNTDGDGLVMDLKSKGIELDKAQVLIIGAGGATQGIIPSLLNAGVAGITIQNRSHEKAQQLAALFPRCQAEDRLEGAYDLVIHATSMGHHGLCPKLQSHWFGDRTVAYDLSYSQAAEPFLDAAQSLNAHAVYEGLGMLYGQAALAFAIWTGHSPTVELN